MRDYTVKTPDQLAPLLRSFRKARGLNQSSAATLIGTTQQAISAIERDASSTSIERFIKLLAALDVELVLRDNRTTKTEGSPRQAGQSKTTGKW